MKKAIIIIVSVLVVAGGAFAGLYFFTPIFNFLKPADENFAMQAKILLGTDEKADYSDYEKFLNRLKNSSGSQTANLDISMNVSLPSSVLDYNSQKMINSSKIKISSSYDADHKATSASAGINYNNEDLLSLDAVVKDQSVSIRSKDIYDKYITLDMSKYEEFCKKNNIKVDKDTLESIEALKKLNSIDSANLVYDLYYISEEDYKALDKNYSNLEDLIDEDNYSSKKNQKVTVDGEEIKTTAYSLTLTGEAGYEFVTNLIKKMKDDSTLKGLVVNKYDIIKKYVNSINEATDNSTTEIPDLRESDLNEAFSELLKSLESAEDGFKDLDQCVKLTIYSAKNKPVKFEVAFLEDKKDNDGTVIFTEELCDGKNIYTIDLDKVSKLTGGSSSSTPSSSYSSSYSMYGAASSYYPTTSSSSSLSSITSAYSKLIITDEYEKSDDSRKGTLTISVKPTSGSAQELLVIKYDIVNSDSEMKLDITASLPSSISSYLSLTGISGLGSGDASVNFKYQVTGLNSDTQKLELKFNGKIGSYSAELAVEGTVSNRSEVPELTSSNSVSLFTLSEEEMKTTYTDIIKSAADKLPAKLSKFGIKDVRKEDILKLLPPEPAVVETPTEPTEPTEEPAA